MTTFLQDKFSWKIATIKEIDWYSFHKGLLKLSITKQLWCVKFIHNRLLLRGEKHQQHDIKSCPLCKAHSENTSHFINCAVNRKVYIEETKKDLKRALASQRIDPILVTLIHRVLKGKLNTIRALTIE